MTLSCTHPLAAGHHASFMSKRHTQEVDSVPQFDAASHLAGSAQALTSLYISMAVARSMRMG